MRRRGARSHVIPAKAGIQDCLLEALDPRLRGDDKIP